MCETVLAGAACSPDCAAWGGSDGGKACVAWQVEHGLLDGGKAAAAAARCAPTSAPTTAAPLSSADCVNPTNNVCWANFKGIDPNFPAGTMCCPDAQGKYAACCRNQPTATPTSLPSKFSSATSGQAPPGGVEGRSRSSMSSSGDGGKPGGGGAPSSSRGGGGKPGGGGASIRRRLRETVP